MGKLKVLVTGAAGFLGSHLSERLQNLNHKVVQIEEEWLTLQQEIDDMHA